MGIKNRWRNTALVARFFIFDARAVLPFVGFLAHIKWWTFGVAVFSFVLFGILERFGISVSVALRLLRSWIAGPVRYGVAWRHKPKDKY